MQPGFVGLGLRANDSAPPIKLCEVARSFSYKLNVGNYESRDFFCSQKAECRVEEAEETSRRLYEFCRTEVMKSVKEYKQQHGLK